MHWVTCQLLTLSLPRCRTQPLQGWAWIQYKMNGADPTELPSLTRALGYPGMCPYIGSAPGWPPASAGAGRLISPGVEEGGEEIQIPRDI